MTEKPVVKVFLDLFAGQQSCRETALAAGLTYVPIDILPRVYCKRTDSYVENTQCNIVDDGTPHHIESLIEKVIDTKKFEVVAIWASPPCTTFSFLNCTNYKKGGAYRKYKSDEEGAPLNENAKKYETCIAHDKLVTNTISIIKHFRTRFENLLYIIENPKNLLRLRPYMIDFVTDASNDCTLVFRDHCCFSHFFRKRSMYYTNSRSLQKCTGSNSTGRCDNGITCSARTWVDENGRKRHGMSMRLAVMKTND